MSIPIPDFHALTPRENFSDDSDDGGYDDGRTSPDANIQEMMLSPSPATKMKRRRELNIQRNEARIKALGLSHSNKTSTKTSTSRKKIKNKAEVKRGMKRIRGTDATEVCTSLQDIENKWPHRSKQIQLLGRSLEAPLLAQKRSNINIGHNHPVVVLGPSGTGKSGIVHDVLGMLRGKYPSILGCAYIDGSLCVSPTDVYGGALRQLLKSFEGDGKHGSLPKAHLKNDIDERIGETNAVDAADCGKSVGNSGSSYKSKLTSQSVAASSCTIFARKLSISLGRNRTAILVIDNAEHVISFGSAGNRVLAQLMMLSSEINVNFRVVAVSRMHFMLNSSVCKYLP